LGKGGQRYRGAQERELGEHPHVDRVYAVGRGNARRLGH
jgi:hypothetical protein